MEWNSDNKGDASFSWLKALVVLLYAFVFIMLFIGIFDHPFADKPAKHRPRLENITDLPAAALTAKSPELGSDGDGEPRAAGVAGPMTDELVRGDILLGRCRLSLVPSLNPHNGWTHTALYAGNGRLIVASNPSLGVIETDIKSWNNPKMTWVVHVRVITAHDVTREKAVEFARQKKGQPYDLNWLGKQEDGNSWYCSELVWAAYLEASGGSIDLARGPGWFGVSPDDIFMHKDTVVTGGHFEKKPDTMYSLLMKALALCILAAGGGILAPHPFVSFGRRRRCLAFPPASMRFRVSVVVRSLPRRRGGSGHASGSGKKRQSIYGDHQPARGEERHRLRDLETARRGLPCLRGR